MDVPAYAIALERTIGREMLLRVVDENADEILAYGRSLFARWLDAS
jgi:hypothetical protein